MKAIGIISIIYGGISTLYGLIYGVFALVFKFISDAIPQDEMHVNEFPFNGEMDVSMLFSKLTSVYAVLIPILLITGVLYLISGIKVLKKTEDSIKLTKVSAISNIAGYLIYVIAIVVFALPLLKTMVPPEAMGFIQGILIVAVIFGGIFICGYPVFLLIYLRNKTIEPAIPV